MPWSIKNELIFYTKQASNHSTIRVRIPVYALNNTLKNSSYIYILRWSRFCISLFLSNVKILVTIYCPEFAFNCFYWKTFTKVEGAQYIIFIGVMQLRNRVNYVQFTQCKLLFANCRTIANWIRNILPIQITTHLRSIK